MNQNVYSSAMQKKSTEDLKNIIDNNEDYTNEARLAAVWELESRGDSLKENLEEAKIEVNRAIEKEAERFTFENTVPKDIPRAVKWATYLMYAAWSLGVINSIFPMSNVEIVVEVGGARVAIVSLFFSFVATLFIVDRLKHRKNWARILYIVLFFVGIVLNFDLVMMLIELKALGVLLLFLVPFILRAIIISLLFSASSNRWFSDTSNENLEVLDADLELEND